MLARRTLYYTPRVVGTTSLRSIHSLPKLLQTAVKEEHAAKTAAQRVRYWIKSLPVETYPLCKAGFVKTYS
jgi:hypothetical protein